MLPLALFFQQQPADLAGAAVFASATLLRRRLVEANIAKAFKTPESPHNAPYSNLKGNAELKEKQEKTGKS